MNYHTLEQRLHEYVKDPGTNIMVQYPDVFIRQVIDIVKMCDSKPTKRTARQKS